MDYWPIFSYSGSGVVKISMKRTVIIGLGISGRSAAAFLLKQKKEVVAVDRNWEELSKDTKIHVLMDQGMELFPDTKKIDFSSVEMVVLSPGVSPYHPLLQEAKKSGIEIIGEVELGFRYLTNKAIGITGTNGKTTVTLLVAHILNTAGFSAKAVGNVGVPLTSYVSGTDILIVELSSFQLETLQQKCLDAAVILNITPDHLDRYPSFNEYAKAKKRIVKALKKGAPLYTHPFLHMKRGIPYTRVKKMAVLQPLISGCRLPIGKENALAAYHLTAQFGVKPKEFMDALFTFSPPPHRIEFVKEINGIFFYNDSKGTNVEAVIHAVKTLQGPIVLIVGGLDKGTSFSPWIQAFKGKVKRIYAIGIAAQKIVKALESDFDVIVSKNLEAAVKLAYKDAHPKDQVLLSPGCASFDCFRNYEHRGEEFKRFVCQL